MQPSKCIFDIRTAIVSKGKIELRGLKLDSAAGPVPLEAYSELEVWMQEFYDGMLLRLTPEEQRVEQARLDRRIS